MTDPLHRHAAKATGYLRDIAFGIGFIAIFGIPVTSCTQERDAKTELASCVSTGMLHGLSDNRPYVMACMSGREFEAVCDRLEEACFKRRNLLFKLSKLL